MPHMYIIACCMTCSDTGVQRWQRASWAYEPAAGVVTGCVTGSQPGTPFWEVYRLFNISDWSLSGVYWKAVFSQAPKVISKPCLLPQVLALSCVAKGNLSCEPEGLAVLHCHVLLV